MTPALSITARAQSMIPHWFAGGLALIFAWAISTTHYVTTGVQFVSPLGIILLAHIAWLALERQLKPGFAAVASGRALITTIGTIACILLALFYLPMPAQATSDTSIVNNLLGLLACLLVLAIVVSVAAIILFAIGKIISVIITRLNRGRSNPPNSGNTRLFDFGITAFAFFALAIASLEGVSGAYSFPKVDRVSVTHHVAAAPADVWGSVAKATSPDFPLPEILKVIPRPVAVVIDEGATMGARRVVRFTGREGDGYLTLQVSRRTDQEVVFQAISDTSPIAKWVQHKAITFRVVPNQNGTRLTVAAEYDRLLSPAWFFQPFIGLAAFFAVDVLARDTKARAELR